MKRPWLLTPKGQRASLHIANLASLLLFAAFVFQFAIVEHPRTQVPQLDTKNVSYCALAECGEVFGIVLENPERAVENLEEQAFGTLLVLDFTNLPRYQGERELWLKLTTPEGKVLEMARVTITLDLKQRTRAEFLLTSSKAEILAGKLQLGY